MKKNLHLPKLILNSFITNFYKLISFQIQESCLKIVIKYERLI